MFPMVAAAGPFASAAPGLGQNTLLPAGVLGFANQNAALNASQLGRMAAPVPLSAASLLSPQGGASAQSNAPGSASFFQGWKLRSGKWLEEEEAYAEVLIEMFDKGQLADCITGSTLRAYLAQKLHCAPMRISKKFAGKGIGKKVYSCRIDTRKNVPAHVIEQRRKLRQRVEEVEKTFHEAASSDAVSCGDVLVAPILEPPILTFFHSNTA